MFVLLVLFQTYNDKVPIVTQIGSDKLAEMVVYSYDMSYIESNRLYSIKYGATCTRIREV